MKTKCRLHKKDEETGWIVHELYFKNRGIEFLKEGKDTYGRTEIINIFVPYENVGYIEILKANQ